MDYLEKLQTLIEEEQLSNFFSLWEEYCFNDVVEADELIQILEKIKNSSLAPLFGKIANTILSLWEKMPEGKEKDRVLVLALDLQTANSKVFYDLALAYVNRKYANRENFNEALRVVGLRDGREFQYSLSRFDFLMHLREGNFVFHSGGWGVGEIMGVSFLQQKLTVEFEGVMSAKDISFETAFKTLTSLDNDHFLARRFGNPDEFEKFAKSQPVEAVVCLLRDLGPKNAKEIKDELVDLVIPEEDWNRWWQAAKVKIKKDARILSPKTAKEPFSLSAQGVSLVSQLQQRLADEGEPSGKIAILYQFIRDVHGELKNPETKALIIDEIRALAVVGYPALEIERDLLLSEYLGVDCASLKKEPIAALSEEEIVTIAHDISIIALQKAFLSLVKAHSSVWKSVFMKMFLTTSSPSLRDLTFKAIKGAASEELKQALFDCAQYPMKHPETFVWFFLRLGAQEDGLFDPKDRDTQRRFLEAALVFLHEVAVTPFKDLGKRVYNFLIGKRYLVVRQIIEGASKAYLKEMLLLSTKCPQFSSGDLNILQGLSEVVCPDLKKKLHFPEDEDVLWTTSESFSRMKAKLQSLTGKEMVDNAKEIEDARALGDLRENSEYKFALERRARLQEEIRVLSEEVNKARILTKDAVFTDRVGVGCRVTLKDEEGNPLEYTILGPWDADPENNILSLKSKLAQEMLNKEVGVQLLFQGKKYTISKICSIWDE